ncbi:hypothetical protein Bhyg_08605, partial [Pseudolycoriella hygida]
KSSILKALQKYELGIFHRSDSSPKGFSSKNYPEAWLMTSKATSTGNPANMFFPNEKMVSGDGIESGICFPIPITASLVAPAKSFGLNFSSGDVPFFPIPNEP